MKTKGALLWGVKQEWEVEEIEMGDPVAHEVQVELAASGLCHSDHHIVTGGCPDADSRPSAATRAQGVVTKVGPGRHQSGPGGRPRRPRLHPRLRHLPRPARAATKTCATSERRAPRRRGHRRRHPPHHRPWPGCSRPCACSGTFSPVRNRARGLRGQDRGGPPPRQGGARRLWRHDRAGARRPTSRTCGPARPWWSSASAAWASTRCRGLRQRGRSGSSPSTPCRSSGSIAMKLRGDPRLRVRRRRPSRRSTT